MNLDIIIRMILEGQGGKLAAADLEKLKTAAQEMGPAGDEARAALDQLGITTQKASDHTKEHSHELDQTKASVKGLAHAFPELNLVVHAFRHPILLAGAAIGGLIAKLLEQRAEWKKWQTDAATTARAYDSIRENVESLAEIEERERSVQARKITAIKDEATAVERLTKAYQAQNEALLATQILNSKFNDELLRSKLLAVDEGGGTASQKTLDKARVTQEYEREKLAQAAKDKREQAAADAEEAKKARLAAHQKGYESEVDSADLPRLQEDVQDSRNLLAQTQKAAENIPKYDAKIVELQGIIKKGGTGGIGGRTVEEAKAEIDQLKEEIARLREEVRNAAGDEQGTGGLTMSQRLLKEAQDRRDKDLAEREALLKRARDLDDSAEKKRAEAGGLDEENKKGGASDFKTSNDAREARLRANEEKFGPVISGFLQNREQPGGFMPLPDSLKSGTGQQLLIAKLMEDLRVAQELSNTELIRALRDLLKEIQRGTRAVNNSAQQIYQFGQ